MDTINYKLSLTNSTIEWNERGVLSKYFLPIVLLILAVICFGGYILRNETGFIVGLAITLVLFILTIIEIKRNDKPFEIILDQQSLGVREIIEPELKRHGWFIYATNQQYLLAGKTNGFIGSNISLLFNKESVFINVQNKYGNGGYFPFSFGRNRKIRKILVGLITNTINDI